MMKFLILTGIYPIKNNPMADIFITRRMKKLKEQGIEFKLLSFHINESFTYRLYKKVVRIPLKDTMKNIRIDDIEYNFISINRNLFDYLNIGNHWYSMMKTAILNELKIGDYDLIHAHGVYPEGYIAALVKKDTGIPCVISAHGSDIMVTPRKNPKILPLTLFALGNSDRNFFTNKNLLLSAQDLGYTSQNYHIFPTIGVDTSVFSLMDKEQARRILQFEQDGRRYVGFIGSLLFVKRAESIPDIFYNIAKTEKDVAFIIIGDGELRHFIQDACEQYQIPVHFLGYVTPEQIPFWMNVLDVLILPSRSEGMPNVVMEAQSCGCPVVGSDAGGIPEAIGFGGVVVEFGSAFEKRFADAVISILSDPPNREQVRESAKRFDSDEIIKKQIRVYEELIKSE